MWIADLAEGGGVDEVDVSRNELGKGVLGAVGEVIVQKLGISLEVAHRPLYTRAKGKVTWIMGRLTLAPEGRVRT